MRSLAGYVTNKKRKTDRKETLKKLNKKLFEENLNRLLTPVNEKNVSLYHFTIHHFFHIPDLFPTFAPLL